MSATLPITRLLRSAWPDATAKHAARASGLSVRTAQAWLSERCTPSAATLLLMAHRNDQLRAELIRRLEAPTHEVMGQMVLPLDGEAGHAPGRIVDGPGRAVAGEKVIRP
jgi:hypothetical protein